MNTKSTYHTRQSEELRTFLKNAQGRHITAGDVCDYFRTVGRPMGMATVYRQLDKLVEEGTAAKFMVDPGSPACFEYLGEHSAPGSCCHCKCQVCGELIHMHCSELDELSRHLFSHHGFTVDPMRTVFWGVCQKCSEVRQCEENTR